MTNLNLIPVVSAQIGLASGADKNEDQKLRIIAFINGMIVHHFEKFISILYRLDISESRINKLLQDFPGEDSAPMILELLLEREQEKQFSRQQFKSSGEDVPGEERW